MPKPPASPKAHPQHGKHDHRACIARAVAKAEALCRDRGVRLTELRRRVLELVWRAHEPIGAYGVLELLRTENDSAAPPTVYRALDFLVEQGLVHRVESRNAYIGCIRPEKPHVCQYLVCRTCGTTAELNDARLASAITRSAAAAGFEVGTQAIEVVGLCDQCRDTAAK